MSEATEPCVEDIDCLPNELCFVNTSFFDINRTFNEGSRPGCSCNTFYAWRGEKCDELSAETWVFILLFLGGAIVALFACFVSGLAFKKHFLELENRRKPNSTVTTSFFTCLGSFGAFGWSLVLSTCNVAVSGRFLAEGFYLERDPYKGRGNVVGFFMAGFAALGVLLATLNICFVWLEIAEQIASSSTKFRIDQIKKYRWTLYAFSAAAFLIAVISQLAQRREGNSDPNILGFTSAPFVFGMIYLYLFAANKISLILGEFSPQEVTYHQDFQVTGEARKNIANNNHLRSVILTVRKTALRASFALLVYGVSQIIFSSIDLRFYNKFGGSGWRETVNPESAFPTAKFFYMTSVLAMCSICVILAQYVYHDKQ